MIKFLDLHKINDRYRKELEASFIKSLDASYYILGPNVKLFENQFANYCNTAYCVSTANGLDALTLILKAYIELGKLRKGDKVMVPANTFIATILSVLHAELEPVFIELNTKTYNISVDDVKLKLSDDIKAIVMVHLYGQLADFNALQDLVEGTDILLIEDAAQAHGAAHNNLHKAGNIGDAAAFSFYPSKNLGALGDGGAITTNDEALFKMVTLLRNYGSQQKYVNEVVGYNSRLDDIQAAFLSVKLKDLDSDNNKRREIAKRYTKGINNLKISLPYYDGTENHVFYAFVVEVDNREDFINYLNQHKIGWLIHYPKPPHKQKALERFSHLKLPITEQIHKRVISLPISPVMTDVEIQTVIDVINAY